MPTDTLESEDVLVENWRITQFEKQGFSPGQITILLLDRIDQHDTEKLLTQGCSHDLVLSILGG